VMHQGAEHTPGIARMPSRSMKSAPHGSSTFRHPSSLDTQCASAQVTVFGSR
jgi:hypothetical protein